MTLSAISHPRKIANGTPYPLGATYSKGFWNFSVFSENPVYHVVVASNETADKLEWIPLYGDRNRTENIWHIAVEAHENSIRWGWVVEPQKSKQEAIIKTDPYAPLLATNSEFGQNQWQLITTEPLLLSTVGLTEPFDWQGAHSIEIPKNCLIIYETHVRGATIHQSSHVKYPGTYLGLIEKIPYFKELGITALELLPIFEFNECEWRHKRPKDGTLLCNFWGYSPLSFFSPMMRYGVTNDPFATRNELRTMIREFHKAGIAIILDVVFNHTGEGNQDGPTYSFKAFGPNTYYLKDEQNKYLNYSGCGNTLQANHPLASDMIITALHHWVLEYGIDGFRFDLASALTRNQDGSPSIQPQLIERIIRDPILANKILIVEPWDASGLYQTGELFKRNQWNTSSLIEWNDSFRDTVRHFIRGDKGYAGSFAVRLCGSQDLYGTFGSPLNSLNFITAHDGFTLEDLVSFNSKHNFDNGELNRDGSDNNISSNYGHEGETLDSKVKRTREIQKKNFITALMLSNGIPMLLGGDEYGHTRYGNNNAWCQDNELNWHQWQLTHHNFFKRFTQELIKMRKRISLLQKGKFFDSSTTEWHGRTLFSPDWGQDAQLVVYAFLDQDGARTAFFAWNMSDHQENIEVPEGKRNWKMTLNTHAIAPTDVAPPEQAATFSSTHLLLPPKTVIVLESYHT